MNPITRLEKWQKQIDQLKARYDETMDCSDEWEADRLQLKYDAYKLALEDVRNEIEPYLQSIQDIRHFNTSDAPVVARINVIKQILTIPEEE